MHRPNPGPLAVGPWAVVVAVCFVASGCSRALDDVGGQVNYLRTAPEDFAADRRATDPAPPRLSTLAEGAVALERLRDDSSRPLLRKGRVRPWVDPPQGMRPDELYRLAGDAVRDGGPGVLVCRLHLTRTEAWDRLSAPDLGARLTVGGEVLTVIPVDPDSRHRYTTYVSVPGVGLSSGDTVGVAFLDADFNPKSGRMGGTSYREVASSTLTFEGSWPLVHDSDTHDVECRLLSRDGSEEAAAGALGRADAAIEGVAAEQLDLVALEETPSTADIDAVLRIVDAASLLGWADLRITSRVTRLEATSQARPDRIATAWEQLRSSLPAPGVDIALDDAVAARAAFACSDTLEGAYYTPYSEKTPRVPRSRCAVVVTLRNTSQTVRRPRLYVEFLREQWSKPEDKLSQVRGGLFAADDLAERITSIQPGASALAISYAPYDFDVEAAPRVVRLRLRQDGPAALVRVGPDDPALHAMLTLPPAD